MTISRRLILGLLLLLPSLASAQNFPAKPIVPLPTGGPNDIIAG
jgi:tripartite-type tricarboxylate transporter receptor subunit TctC